MTFKQSIPWAQPTLWGNEQKYMNDALTSTWISGGPYVDRFEKEFLKGIGSGFAVSTSNGTSALHLLLLALGIEPGDEIIVPGFGFMAAANIALHIGAKPVFAEVDPETWCLNASEIEKCITPRTRAVVPVHTYGNICAMDEIRSLANHHNITVVEDAAEAFFSKYKGRFAGTIGTAGCFSFQATKTITTGEGGMVVTEKEELFRKMNLFRNHGMMKKRYWHEVPGHNFRLTNFQAAMGCAQLEKLDEIIQERQRIYNQYNEHLSREPGLMMQYFTSDVNPVLWAMAVKMDTTAYFQGRDNVMKQMGNKNIETRPGFYAASMLEIYSCHQKLPVCEDISKQVISLPTFPGLQNEQIEFICTTLKKLKR